MIDAQDVQQFVNYITDNWGSVTDSTSVGTLMDTYWTNNMRSKFYKDVIRSLKEQNLVGSSQVTGITITAGGTDYEVGDMIYFKGDGTSAAGIVTSVDESGVITGIEVSYGGSGYATAPTNYVTTSDLGSGATFTTTISVGVSVVNTFNDSL